jgi:hypothetical protein
MVSVILLGRSQNSQLQGVSGDQVFDFGYIPQGHIVKHTFAVANPGTEKIRIFDVQASCSCTLVDDIPDEILPKEVATIPVKLKTAEREGKYVAIIKVHLEKYGWIELRLTGTVFRYAPSVIDFGLIKKGGCYEEEIRVMARPGWDLKIENLKFDHSIFNVEQKQDVVAEEETLVLEIKTRALGYGQFDKVVSIRTNDPECSVNNIRIKGYIEDIVRCVPERLFWGVLGDEQNAKRQLKVYSPYGYSLKINKLTVSDESISVHSTVKGKEIQLAVDLDRNIAKPTTGLFKGAIFLDLLVNDLQQDISVDVIAVLTQNRE